MNLILPIFESKKIGEQGDFDIFFGLNKSLVEQVKKYSADKTDIDLQNNTDDGKRFVEGTYEDWYKKGRSTFALVNKSGTLAAMVRIGEEPLFEDGDNWHTIAWRSYKPFRGTGIMKPFTNFAIGFYKKEFPEAKLWATANTGNIGSIKLAESVGLEVDQDKSEMQTMKDGRPRVVMSAK